MGTPDSFGTLGIQLKVGNPICRHFKLGQKVADDIPDGVYVDYSGVVVIKDRVFVAEFPELHTKYADSINLKDLLHNFNPVVQGMEQALQELGAPKKP